MLHTCLPYNGAKFRKYTETFFHPRGKKSYMKIKIQNRSQIKNVNGIKLANIKIQRCYFFSLDNFCEGIASSIYWTFVCSIHNISKYVWKFYSFMSKRTYIGIAICQHINVINTNSTCNATFYLVLIRIARMSGSQKKKEMLIWWRERSYLRILRFLFVPLKVAK